MTDLEIGLRLRIIRTYRRWSQKRLGAVVHGGQTKISLWEHGVRHPHFLEFGLMATALCFSLDVFFHSEPFDITACLLPMPPEPEVVVAEA